MSPNETQRFIEMSSEDLDAVRGGIEAYSEYMGDGGDCGCAGEDTTSKFGWEKSFRVCATISSYYWPGSGWYWTP